MLGTIAFLADGNILGSCHRDSKCLWVVQDIGFTIGTQIHIVDFFIVFDFISLIRCKILTVAGERFLTRHREG